MSICLSMMVKNESAELPRSLGSIKHLIDRWVIVDTGSTDGTSDVAEGLLKGIPGRVEFRPWKNWAWNRSEALGLAQAEGCDWILRMDADDELVDFEMPELNEENVYYIDVEYGRHHFAREFLLNSRMKWEFIGVTHEYLKGYNQPKPAHVKGRLVTKPARPGKDKERFLEDARLLEQELIRNPQDQRSQFYLAQSYKDSGQFDKAIEAYQKRFDMGGWKEEMYFSLLMIAMLKERTRPVREVVEAYVKAFEFRPERRGETLRHLGRYAIEAGSDCPLPNDILFVEKMFYNQ